MFSLNRLIKQIIVLDTLSSIPSDQDKASAYLYLTYIQLNFIFKDKLHVKTMAINSFDIDFKQLTKSIFDNEPLNPWSLRLEFLSNIDQAELFNLLGYFVQYGSKHLYQKELALLSSDEIDVIRQYLQSIGYDAEYNLNQTDKKVVTDYRENGTSFKKRIQINNWQIVFKTATLPNDHGCGTEATATANDN